MFYWSSLFQNEVRGVPRFHYLGTLGNECIVNLHRLIRISFDILLKCGKVH